MFLFSPIAMIVAGITLLILKTEDVTKNWNVYLGLFLVIFFGGNLMAYLS